MGIEWELLDSNHTTTIPKSRGISNSSFTPPSSLEEAEALLKVIPIKPDDYEPLLNLSYAVPTAEILSKETWRLSTRTLSL